MAGHFGMGLQAGTQALRFGWYFGLNRMVEWQSRRLGGASREKPQRPVPSTQAILADLGQLFLRDAMAVRDGIFPPTADGESVLGQLRRAQLLLADLPGAHGRREARDASSVRGSAQIDGLPDYFTQDFHYQTGGYLTAESARLYDIQVETLFLGGAGPMRREALRPIAEFLRGRDQRKMRLLDVACGTGRFLRDVRLTWPALQLSGIDLSEPYVTEARRHMHGLRRADIMVGNAEHLPFADASQDVVTTIFLFHELPPDVRRRVAAEMARVLKPDGLLVFIDSLQFGDRPDWDGLLEAFPSRFHEPYYRHYAVDDLDAVFAEAGLPPVSTSTSYLSKMMVRRRSAD
jgi:ubiquinone/menaquinone biosynthesis C-methylase UbiE